MSTNDDDYVGMSNYLTSILTRKLIIEITWPKVIVFGMASGLAAGMIDGISRALGLGWCH